MTKTDIEWTDITLNWHWGCKNGCSYCSARNIARRFGRRIGTLRAKHRPDIYTQATIEKMVAFEPVFLPDQLDFHVSPKFRSKNPALPLGSAMVFIEEMGDWLGPWMRLGHQQLCIEIMRRHPKLIFQCLTKFPENMPQFNPWPGNAWAGATATCQAAFNKAIRSLHEVQAPVHFISFEPLLGPVNLLHPFNAPNRVLNQIIIGAQTGPGAIPPDKKWVDGLIEIADAQGIPVFIKDNLNWPIQRREWPEALRAKSEAFNHEVCRLPQSID